MMNVAQLIEKLQTLPQDKPILCQVVGKENGAWNMDFDFHDVPHSWMIQLAVTHPDLLNLPMEPFK